MRAVVKEGFKFRFQGTGFRFPRLCAGCGKCPGTERHRLTTDTVSSYQSRVATADYLLCPNCHMSVLDPATLPRHKVLTLQDSECVEMSLAFGSEELNISVYDVQIANPIYALAFATANDRMDQYHRNAVINALFDPDTVQSLSAETVDGVAEDPTLTKEIMRRLLQPQQVTHAREVLRKYGVRLHAHTLLSAGRGRRVARWLRGSGIVGIGVGVGLILLGRTHSTAIQVLGWLLVVSGSVCLLQALYLCKNAAIATALMELAPRSS